MKYCGILVILLFLLTGCSGPNQQTIELFSPTDRVFSETDDPELILTDATPQVVLSALKERYNVVNIDFQSDNSLYATVHADPVFRLVVVENDLSGEEPFLIMITRH